MSRFKQEGEYPVIIKDVYPAEKSFGSYGTRRGIAIVCEATGQDDSGNMVVYVDEWFGDFGQEYIPGTEKTRTQATMQTLHSLGMQGDDLTHVQGIVGKSAVAKVEEKNGYCNIKYLNGASSSKRISMEELIASVTGQAAPPPQMPAPQQAQQAPPQMPPPPQQQAPAQMPNPFAR